MTIDFDGDFTRFISLRSRMLILSLLLCVRATTSLTDSVKRRSSRDCSPPSLALVLVFSLPFICNS